MGYVIGAGVIALLLLVVYSLCDADQQAMQMTKWAIFKHQGYVRLSLASFFLYKEGIELRTEIPIWNKYLLSIEEAASYFHIGVNKMHRLVSQNTNAPWVLWNSNRAMIKRKTFENYIERINAL